MNKDLMFSSKSDLWSTAPEDFEKLDKEFHFTLDPCATIENKKCSKFFTAKEDGLIQNWGGHKVFCNPPYGRGLKNWIKKCYEESFKPDTLIVLLIPARTDTQWFHQYIWCEETNAPREQTEVRFIKGRLTFGDSKNAAPFPSMIIIFNRTS